VVFLLAFSSIPFPASAQPKIETTHDCMTTQQLYRSGRDVSVPKVIHSVEPKLSQAARKSNESVSVLVTFCVETNGSPSNVSVVRVDDNKTHVRVSDPDSNPILKELEESAIEATKQYKFEPAKKDGEPVKVILIISINFQAS
jgi:protein TonB